MSSLKRGKPNNSNSNNDELVEIAAKKPKLSVLSTKHANAEYLGNQIQGVQLASAPQVSEQPPRSASAALNSLNIHKMAVINPVNNQSRSASAAPSQGGKHKRKHHHTRRSNKKQNKRTRRNRK
jgi:hypothetical protein